MLIIGDYGMAETLLGMDLPHVISMYVLGDRWFLRWKNTKILDVFDISEEDRMVSRLRDDFQKYFNRRWSAGESIFNLDQHQRALGELGRDNARFMWFQLFVKMLLSTPLTSESKNHLLEQSYLAYQNDPVAIKMIHKFKREYTSDDAIEWYTRDSFLYRLLNQACRTSDVDLMFSFRFFIRELNAQLSQVYERQKECLAQQSPFMVYRGTALFREELEMLQRNVGNFISRLTFVSTSKDKEVAMTFANEGEATAGDKLKIFVLEEIWMDATICTAKAFAEIREFSLAKGEAEVLLSIGTVFRIDSVQKLPVSSSFVKTR